MFDRFDICQAHYMFAMLFHGGQGSAIYAKFAQLERVGYRPGPMLSNPSDLTWQQKYIYMSLIEKHIGIKNPSLLPETYLQVTNNSSGMNWIMPIGDDDLLDLETLVDKWVDSEFCGELERNGNLAESWGGDFYAAIRTNGAKLDSAVVWESCGFFLK